MTTLAFHLAHRRVVIKGVLLSIPSLPGLFISNKYSLSGSWESMRLR